MDSDLFRVSEVDGVAVVELSLPQSLESAAFDRLNDTLLQLIGHRPGARWVLDLTQVSYMGSSTLGLMVNVRQRVKQAGGRLILCCLAPRLLQVFRTCCLERLFVIAHSRADAIKRARD